MSPSILEMSSKTEEGGPSRGKFAEIQEDIREGLHVVMLGEAASEEPHTKRMAAAVAEDHPHVCAMPSIEEALKIYKKYQELHELDACGDAEEPDLNDYDDNEEDECPVKQQGSRVALALENGISLELMPIGGQRFCHGSSESLTLQATSASKQRFLHCCARSSGGSSGRLLRRRTCMGYP
jgi:hypothetical protein